MSSCGKENPTASLADRMQLALQRISEGRAVVLVDDETRENEGDLTVATVKITPELVTFMGLKGRGLICVSIDAERAQQLNLPLQTTNNNSRYRTPFAVSVDHISVGDVGITAASRAATMAALIDPTEGQERFVSPGHVFPLIVHPHGVFGRQGQTEASYDLARLAGLPASGVICELLGADGETLKGAALMEFCIEHDLPLISVQDVLRYRVRNEVAVRISAESVLSTDFGEFRVFAFQDDVSGKEHLALIYGDTSSVSVPPLVRVHSECLTGDLFGSRRCDCGPQLEGALKLMVREGAGALLYLRQEGRGIGLANKVKAYALQELGRDTVEANLELGFAADERDFFVAARMLQLLNIASVRLITNNPEKLTTLQNAGITVSERVSMEIGTDPHCEFYLLTKKNKLGHLFGMGKIS